MNHLPIKIVHQLKPRMKKAFMLVVIAREPATNSSAQRQTDRHTLTHEATGR